MYSTKVLYIIISTICATIMAVNSTAQPPTIYHYFDSLTEILYHSDNDLERLKAVESINQRLYNSDSISKYADIQLEIASRLHNITSEINAKRYKAKASFRKNNYVESIERLYEVLAIADSVGDRPMMALCYSDLGDSYRMILKGNTAVTNYYKALEIHQEEGNDDNMSNIYRGIGDIYCSSEMYQEARIYYCMARDLDKVSNNYTQLCEDYLGLGVISYTLYGTDMYCHRNDSLLESAKRDFITALNLSQEYSSTLCKYKACFRLASSLCLQIRIGNHSKKRKQEILDSCEYLMAECHKTFDAIPNQEDWLRVNVVDGQLLLAQNKYRENKAHLDSLANIVKNEPEEIYWKEIPLIYRGLLEYYLTIKDNEGAFQTLGLLRESEHRNVKINFMADAAQSLVQAEFENKLKAREIEMERRNSTTQALIWSSLVIICLLVIFSIILASNIRKRIRNNILLDEKNEELNKQNKLLATINHDLSDSINYASVIQRAVMPSKAIVRQIWGDGMVLLQPLSVVSGDFYWTTQIDKYKMLVVGDCTGHGVPGAFISMLGINILETLAGRTREQKFDAGYLLNEIRRLFIHSIMRHAESDQSTIEEQQANNETTNLDGIDMALLIVNSETLEAHFAGAFRPLIIVRDGKVTSIAGDRMPVGRYIKDQTFTDNEIQLQENDCIYMYTDGMTDQFGYDNSKNRIVKFGHKRLHQLISEICDMPFTEQKKRLKEEMVNWRKDPLAHEGIYEQTDDALLVGIRI